MALNPNLDLAIKTIIAATKGNVDLLPTFMVHDNEAWPWPDNVRVDNKNRIHLRRATFLRCVSNEVPVRAGVWRRFDCQEFHIDLKPHHLQGSEDMAPAAKKADTAFPLVKADSQGLTPDEEGFNDAPRELPDLEELQEDIARIARDGSAATVQSTVFSSVDSE